MTDEPNDAGLIQVLAERLEIQLLPRALALKDTMDQGATLTDFDIRFLEEVLENAQRIQPMLDRHPEWHTLAAKVVTLYKQITEKALENEATSRASP